MTNVRCFCGWRQGHLTENTGDKCHANALSAFCKTFFEKLSNAIRNTHCNAERANAEPKKGERYFFIPGHIGWDDWATCAFFHGCTFCLAEKVINAYCGQYNGDQAKNYFVSFCHCLIVLPAFIPEKLNDHPVGKTIFYFLF
jgi:hypothetical protein